ncbi:hypothetical protein JCM11641_003519 [Rhodosporidiobolus odoratus]
MSTAARQRESINQFVQVTGASSADASRFLKAAGWRLDRAMDTYFSVTSKASAQVPSASVLKNLDTLWAQYRDASTPDEIAMEGTMRYCEDIGVDPEEPVMLALAWFTKAPTMGRFSKKPWMDAWQAAVCDNVEKQRQHVVQLRSQLADADVFRRVYNYAFDYVKADGQKSMQFEIAQALWSVLVPLDPASSFPPEHLMWWCDFLQQQGAKAVSKDTWNLFLDFVRTIDSSFVRYDEEGEPASSRRSYFGMR